jgi:aminopeptidase
MGYEPPSEVLERYGRLLVDFALADGKGVQPGETVEVVGEEATKPLLAEVCRAVWRSGGNVILELEPSPEDPYDFQKIFFEEASETQLDFFAGKYLKGRQDEVDHMVYIAGSSNPKGLEGVDPKKVMRRQAAQMPKMRWQDEKERAGAFHWTIGVWGTPAMAAEAGITLEEYWEQIIRACRLDDSDPIARWRETTSQVYEYRDWLNSLPIERLHLEADGTDLWLTLGERRRWVGGSGRNIPSFEIFTSPDWRGTEGRVRFTEPLYVFGSLLRGVELEFRDGLVVQATAEENEQLIQQVVGAQGGNKVGEFSLTDARLSPIDRFMADTLYDENMGGPFGNTHIAVGLSLTDTYDGDRASISDDEWERLGYNTEAAVHVDIVATSDRTVTATMKDRSERVIYADGQFQLG